VLRLFLQVWNQFPDVFRLHRGNGGSLAKLPFSLLTFARQQVALETFVSLDLPGGSHAKSFRCGSIRFYLRHVISPIRLIVCVKQICAREDAQIDEGQIRKFEIFLCGYLGVTSMAIFLPSRRGSMSTLAIS
jgi:hypothetical protein